MTSETNRDRQKQQTQQRIFKAAVKLIRQQGYQATTIRQITQAAHVSQGTFYVHYKSKEDIIRRSYYDELASYVSDHYQLYLKTHPKATVRERLLAFSMLQLQLSAEQGWQIVALVFTSFFSEVLDPGVELRPWSMLDTLRQLMVTANQAGMLVEADPEIAFQQLYTSVRGIMATWVYSRGSFDIVSAGRGYLTTVLDGLLFDEHVQ